MWAGALLVGGRSAGWARVRWSGVGAQPVGAWRLRGSELGPKDTLRPGPGQRAHSRGRRWRSSADLLRGAGGRQE
ncbi:MAG: hypothetical protein ACPIOQ_34315 [Promethearchaeia archaeon]